MVLIREKILGLFHSKLKKNDIYTPSYKRILNNKI